jgi:hypothetical protein
MRGEGEPLRRERLEGGGMGMTDKQESGDSLGLTIDMPGVRIIAARAKLQVVSLKEPVDVTFKSIEVILA